jgi:hypothetical protein
VLSLEWVILPRYRIFLLTFGTAPKMWYFYFCFHFIYIIMWSCPGNMPKYYPGLRDILPDRRVIIRIDAHIQNTIRNVGIRKQEDLYKPVSLIQIRKIKQVVKWILNKQNGTSDILYVIQLSDRVYNVTFPA